MGLRLNIWIILAIFCVPARLRLFSNAQPLVPCYFIFGDSLVDNGNNIFHLTLAKTNYPPYGIDYPGGHYPGRFTNGRTLVDFIAEYLGFEGHIPPHAFTSGTAILNGLNYASGAGGIRGETGTRGGFRVSFDGQLLNHEGTVSTIFSLRGKDAANYLNKCLYTVGMGSNDYLNNYLFPVSYHLTKLYTPTEYANLLIKQHYKQLTKLYNLGARKVAIFGVGPIGCTPANIFWSPSNTCLEEANKDAQIFDSMLPALVDNLNKGFPDARFIYVNVSNLLASLPSDIGNVNTTSPCCEIRPFTGLCVRYSEPCKDRGKYLFFDAYHPTERFVKLGAERSYKATSPLDVYPHDISTLVQLRL